MSFEDYLYKEKNVPAILKRYIDELMEGNITDQIHANKLTFYLNILKDRNYKRGMTGFFHKLCDLIDKKHPNLCFYLDGRIKSLISYEMKIRRYISCSRPLDDIRDIFAYRIVLFGDEEIINLHQHCYLIMENVIEFAVSQGFSPCKRTTLMDLYDIPDEPAPGYVQEFKYFEYVKDYITYPKKNGYQALHVTFVNPKGRYIEVQVKTLKMHKHAESGEAKHSLYKMDKYFTLTLDRKRIAASGYSYSELNYESTLIDYSGIEEPEILFSTTKSF